MTIIIDSLNLQNKIYFLQKGFFTVTLCKVKQQQQRSYNPWIQKTIPAFIDITIYQLHTKTLDNLLSKGIWLNHNSVQISYIA